MLRNELMSKGLGVGQEFRIRGLEVSRIENFVDAVFAFSLTLLVVSLEVPKTYDELVQTMSGFLAFAVCFSLLFLIWWTHYSFFRKYGLQDGWTLFLNAVLSFLVLFYIYPLKFLFNLLINIPLGSAAFRQIISIDQLPRLMIIYSCGFLAVFLVFLLLTLNAWRLREALELNRVEMLETRQELGSHIIMIGAALFSIALALTLPSPIGPASAGWIYVLIGPAQFLLARQVEKKKKRLLQESEES